VQCTVQAACTLIAVLTHIFQLICVTFTGRRRRPTAVERQSIHRSLLMTD